MKKNNKNVFSRSSESTKTSRPSHVKKPTGRADRVPRVTVDNHPALFRKYYSVAERGPLFSFEICLLNEFSKQHCHFITSMYAYLKLQNSEKGVKCLFFNVSKC